MKPNSFSIKEIYNLPHWNTIHEEYCLLSASIADEGRHPIYFKFNEVSNLKIEGIQQILEGAFHLDLGQFGLKGHTIPVINFNNNQIQWLVYELNAENQIEELYTFHETDGLQPVSEQMESLLKTSITNYETESTTAQHKGKFLNIERNPEAPLLLKLTNKEARAYMKTQEDPECFDDLDDPMSYFIVFDDNDKAKAQDDQFELRNVYHRDHFSFKNYFGAVPFRNQNGFQVPVYKRRELPFVGQFNDRIFGGYDTYNFVFYDANSRIVAIFQQMT